MGKAKRLKEAAEWLYDAALVPLGFDYWYYKLLNFCLGMYKYSGLPESLPAREIELNLLLTGHAAIFKDGGELVTTVTELFGFDKYWRPTKAVFGNLKINSRKLVIGKDCELIFNNRIRSNVLRDQEVDGALSSFIKRYARLLADCESTIDIRLVNSRQPSYAVGSTQAAVEQIKNTFREVEMGKRSVMIDNAFAEAIRMIDTANHTDVEKVNDLLIARDKILSMFYRDVGVKFEQEQKRAQMTDEEVTADDQLLLINISDMLEERREGLERVNKHFGTSITVEISPLFKREKQEVKENDIAENRVNV